MTADNSTNFLARIVRRSMGKASDDVGVRPAVTPDILPYVFHTFEHQEFANRFSFRSFPSMSFTGSRSNAAPLKLNLSSQAAAKRERAVGEKLSDIPTDSASADDGTNDVNLNSSNKISNIASAKNNGLRQQKESKGMVFTISKDSVSKDTRVNIKEERQALTFNEGNLTIPMQKENSPNQDINANIKGRIETPAEITSHKSPYSESTKQQYSNQAKSAIPLTRMEPEQYNRTATVHVKSYSSDSQPKLNEGNNNTKIQRYFDSNVTINIGRIEVRATLNQKSSSGLMQKNSSPTLSLRDYLRNRSRGGIQ